MPEEETGGLPDGFATTQWSLVLAAQETPQPSQALEGLCRVYWLPVFVFVRRCGFDRPDAEDLTQAFFVHILQRDWLSHADPERGRFRGFLRASVRQFVQRSRRAASAEKRGGRMGLIEIEQIERAEREVLAGPTEMEPDEVFRPRVGAHTSCSVRSIDWERSNRTNGGARFLRRVGPIFWLRPRQAITMSLRSGSIWPGVRWRCPCIAGESAIASWFDRRLPRPLTIRSPSNRNCATSFRR